MHYRLRENLSCCDVDGHLIFLDVAQDRYFKLTGTLERAMRRFQVHEDIAPTLVEGLAAAQILVEAPNPKTRAARASILRPTCSAIEQPITFASQRISMAIVVEVMAIVWSTRRHLKTRTLKTNLDEASAYRNRKTCVRGDATPAADEGKLLQASGQFARARRYAPIEPICLLDSLSMLRFLSRRGLSANIVFGVTPEPFAAHCWIQAGDMVLNETLFDTHAYTPIRLV
ncbi:MULTISPECIES: lasso peptide biosynthesis B2 protein [Rhodanobacter]|uniref:lasso peptide biosynthesis B2 protein n=1 Tax=Rhodanobacter TaxID=75309 RepID=UPI0004845F9F|nr:MULTISPECIES: lasso peptide biosynthesis B2 protein [Rhodanobacter]TAN18344.1 MAG: lasso peptide biosynthesis B2 protein [Rhodanobacter sp.]UJJ54737.1 lasso peptide biosynthesis B2 protein [Rhodanobacter thiooxydans]